jgi:predicted chitinase
MRACEFVTENFADGKKPGRKGLAKRSGVNTKASVSSLRKTAKHSTGEKARMAHWLANMKAGRAKHEDIDEGWKDWVAGAAIGAAALGGHGDAEAAKKKQPDRPAITKQVKADPAVDKKIADIKKQVNAPSNIETSNLSNNPQAEHLVQKVAIQAGIKGVELAQFMAQVSHESAEFAHMKEKGGKLDFKKYDPRYAPRTAKILGNKHAGDGERYKGRGYIQITGRDNYRMAGKALGLPLEEKPELAATPEVAAKIAVWYWQTRVASKVNNFNDTAAVTKTINPAMRGLDDRKENFDDYKKILVAMR